jgi:acyl-CoA synthetase (AMP-forming)/AMP-acid ligase II
VALSHEATLNQLASYSEAIRLNEGDIIVSWLPLYHDMGLIAGFLLPIVQGIPLVLMSPFDWAKHPALLLRAIHEYEGTLCWLPNFAYNHCARRIRRHDTEDLSLQSMRMFINCSEPVYHQSHQLFLERFAGQGLIPEMFAVSYAMAENTFAVTQTKPGQATTVDVIDRNTLAQDNIAQPVPAGKDAENGNTLEERRVGELSVRSDCMLTEYFRRPDLQPFQNGWYLTGDKGYIADGDVYVVGRSKDMIINAGKNIFPRDIETIVNQVNGIHAGRSVVFGVPDEREGTELIAVVAEVDTSDLEERKQIARAIRKAIVQQSMVTATYVHLVESKWLIKTSSGKVARAANREKWEKERATVNNQQPTNNN